MVMVTVEILEIEVLFCTYVWVTSYTLIPQHFDLTLFIGS